ncbi:Mth938-like domain-containing protein [Chitinivorax sp. B]|uniref:Mth938-like domain-containing protein n=1 Tax=Chitinivorax sp. B TaxID=2502235 RepID=UPI0010F63FA2|nr:Mth938-like domain-containing protein [Chitinivorax sp. B]
MKLHLSTTEGYLFTGYGEGYVDINRNRHEGNLLVTANTIVPWSTPDFASLDESHFTRILEHDPEVVLLGTGARLRFPHPRLYKALTARQVGLEVMDTAAMCRTFNILTTEGRRVVAAIIHD